MKNSQKQKAPQPLNKTEPEQINHVVNKHKTYTPPPPLLKNSSKKVNLSNEEKENFSTGKKNMSTLTNTPDNKEMPDSKKMNWDKGVLDSLVSVWFLNYLANITFARLYHIIHQI